MDIKLNYETALNHHTKSHMRRRYDRRKYKGCVENGHCASRGHEGLGDCGATLPASPSPRNTVTGLTRSKKKKQHANVQNHSKPSRLIQSQPEYSKCQRSCHTDGHQGGFLILWKGRRWSSRRQTTRWFVECTLWYRSVSCIEAP